ncbi:hypothetical protein Nepgr_020455 [Nepenthes gracilis]|uniref:Uncharacterized protein n=1 Tax=Nepenthes gracilis TaxID=150966 RepID=A0AAD3XW28_NEPGR|nr:hypothetical protein Nepgr_020455 [Nepenthes gracilis]
MNSGFNSTPENVLLKATSACYQISSLDTWPLPPQLTYGHSGQREKHKHSGILTHAIDLDNRNPNLPSPSLIPGVNKLHQLANPSSEVRR